MSLQKAVRDKEEGIPVTNIYYGISWFALIVSILLMGIGLYNAGSIILSEKGFLRHGICAKFVCSDNRSEEH